MIGDYESTVISEFWNNHFEYTDASTPIKKKNVGTSSIYYMGVKVTTIPSLASREELASDLRTRKRKRSSSSSHLYQERGKYFSRIVKLKKKMVITWI